jgi:hypothetical protein
MRATGRGWGCCGVRSRATKRRGEHLHAGRGGCAYHAVLRHARLFEQVRGDAGGGDEAACIELHFDPLAKSGRVAVTYLMREAIMKPHASNCTSTHLPNRDELPLRTVLAFPIASRRGLA